MPIIGVFKRKNNKQTMKQLIFRAVNFSEIKEDKNLHFERTYHVLAKIDMELSTQRHSLEKF